MLGAGGEAAFLWVSRQLRGSWSGFWRVLGGVGADSGSRDSDEGSNEIVAVLRAGLVLSLFLKCRERNFEIRSLVFTSATRIACSQPHTTWIQMQLEKNDGSHIHRVA
jgi:hypothetical protein